MSDTDYTSEVARGALIMDDRAPEGWESMVDLNKLNMESPCQCVVGQVFGNYFDSVAELSGTLQQSDWSQRYGFEIDVSQLDNEMALYEWGVLAQTWRDLIGERRVVQS